MIEIHRISSVEWKPCAVVALATSVDESQVAAAREDGSLEIWLVSPGSVGWHCQLIIHGDPHSRVSSLAWCRPGSRDAPSGRLFSSSIDGSVSEWDLFNLKQKVAIGSIGVSIWQIAVAPYSSPMPQTRQEPHPIGNGFLDDKYSSSDDSDASESEEDTDSDELHDQPYSKSVSIALACDDGCVRIYKISESDELIYYKSLPRVSGRILSVAWSPDAMLIYSGSSDGFIRCWDAEVVRERYRITAGVGGLGSGSDLCIWSLLALRSGTLVSADSSGSVQFWDVQHGTLLQAHSLHKGDAYALAAAPSHNRVFSAGSDGQVILYKHSSNEPDSGDASSTSKVSKQWTYIGYIRAHTHDVRALTMAVPISQEDPFPVEKVIKPRGWKKPIDFSYSKWAHLGVPMLISAGDDTKLFAYSAVEFINFSPHDICPAPQRVPIQLVRTDESSLLLVQSSYWLDILSLHTKNCAASGTVARPSGSSAFTNLLARVKSKMSQKIICSTISASGMFFAYSSHVESRLFELKRCGGGQSSWSINKRPLSRKLPFAHCMTFSSDSSRLMIAGHDRVIYVVDVCSSKILHTFTPSRGEHGEELSSMEPPITRMFCSSDDQWLAAVNCFGDIYIFNLEILRQHWFISRLNGAAVTAGGFTPQNDNILIISTSSNQVYAFDVEARQLGEWSMRNTFVLPRRYQDFPGEVLGLSFPPCSSSSRVIIYSARAMCWIDFGMPVEHDHGSDFNSVVDSVVTKKTALNGKMKRKLRAYNLEMKVMGSKNFDFCAFRDPVLFVGHLKKNSVLVIDKPWLEVVKTLDAPPPVHRHLYGT